MPKNEIRGVGQVVMIQDNEGNVISLWKTVRKEAGTVPVRLFVPPCLSAGRGTARLSEFPKEHNNLRPILLLSGTATFPHRYVPHTAHVTAGCPVCV